ncbi:MULTISPECIES: cytochrome c biogenesis protein CcsA [Paenibacillus]|uniref:Cytochrome c biogenesis protein ResC n=1 Tax=Paenibacillus glycanilyticus TaxID=126569 RepID=A0ABQ6NP05_9BACL|nr:cytochrome c biogenesis protein CcsA [Paenibacillus glycanilyticus]MCK9857368.1 cytochrome c biogenesis protein CcsA [Paenibacillus sp. ATY16]GMK46264.1 cytochrome c biogenesis protein ResC [Paenibacillus glycanilyticus]
MSYVDFSSDAFIAAFFLYCFAFLFYVVTIAGKKWSNRDPIKHEQRWSRISFVTSTLGLIAHLTFFFTRWIGSGQIPTSNMYEFITFLGMAIMIAFTIVYAIYRKPLLGMFALPLVVLVVAYASVFPQEVQPLIPALSSIWLKVHVTTAALGEAFFAVGFAAGLMYLLRVVDFKQTSKEAKRDQFWVEFSLYTIVLVIGFIAIVFIFRGAGYQATFTQENVTIDSKGVDHSSTDTAEYTLPPIVKPYNSTADHMDSFLGMDKPLFEAPSWMKGVNAGRKLNTVIWSVIAGSILYGLIRLLFRKRIGAVIHPLMGDIDPDDLDEISYRAIAIGFPVFTLGALIFAMIWANIAWGRFWGWDPKEVWALISWLYYSAYLHFRLSRGWQGKRSSWLAVIGFVVILFTLVGVNLVIAGLHSYAGV